MLTPAPPEEGPMSEYIVTAGVSAITAGVLTWWWLVWRSDR